MLLDESFAINFRMISRFYALLVLKNGFPFWYVEDLDN